MSGRPKSEDIILLLNNIRYKKNNGSLYLSSKRIGWMMENEDTCDISIEFTTVRNQKISPEGKAKVQLQLILSDQTTHTFHFTNPEGKEKQVAERDKVKEKLIQLVVQNRRKPPDELLEKKRILEENPHLKELYVSLVRTEILSSDDFWKEIAAPYKQTLGPALDVGVSGGFLADIKPQTDGSNGRVLYNLTPEVMAAIFKTYPTVKRKHEEFVPHQMSEAEFWTRFFQSHYYSVHTTSKSENVFSECAKRDDREWIRDINTIRFDPFFDLNDIYEDKPLDLDQELRASGSKGGSNHIHATMIKRFNQHSLNILKSQTASQRERISQELSANNLGSLPNGQPHPEVNFHKDKKARIEEKMRYDDLQDSDDPERPSFVIHQKSRYLTGPTPDFMVESVMQKDLPALQKKLHESLERTPSDLRSSLHPKTALRALQQYSDLSRNPTSSSSDHVSTVVLPRDLHSELAKVYSSACELFRHFWACFPPRTPQLQERLHKMSSTLSRFHRTAVRDFQELAVREYNCKSGILEHLEEMFQVANSKYENWKSRNRR